MSPKRYLFLSQITIRVRLNELRGYTLLLCLILGSFTHAATQDRPTLEANRMNLFQEVEKIEYQLVHIKNKKSDVLARINNLELKIERKDFGLATTPKVIPQTKKKATPQVLAPTTTDVDYTDSYNAILRQHLRTQLFNKSKGNPSQASIQKQLRETSYIKSLRAYIDQHPVETIIEDASIPDFVSNEAITEETQELPEVVEVSNSVTTGTEMKAERRQLLNQVAALTDIEQQLDIQLRQLLASVEGVNLELDKVIRSSLTFSSNSGSVTSRSSTTSTQVSLPTAADFSQIDYKKGFLPWPIKNPQVTSRFGQQEHSSTFNVFVNNNGINIESSSTNVLAIYDGEVLSLTYDNKGLATIILQHSSDVYSVYSKLSIARVNQGEQMSQGQLLGAASEKPSGQANLHFEIWKSEESQNPLHWLQNN